MKEMPVILGPHRERLTYKKCKSYCRNKGTGIYTVVTRSIQGSGASDYSKAFVQGMRATQTNPQTYGSPPQANTPSVIGGEYHLTGTYNSKSSTPMTIDVTNNAHGFDGKLKITVTKLHK